MTGYGIYRLSRNRRTHRDRTQRVKALEQELNSAAINVGSQLASKDELIKQLQEQVNVWRNKYEALAKLYSQLRTEHLDMLSKFKQFQLKANSAQEAIDKMERMEKNLNAKNLELADMIRERDRARFELDRQKSSHKDELDRLRREINFANERAEDATRSKSSEVSLVLSKYNRQIQELEDSLRVSFQTQYRVFRMLTILLVLSQAKQIQIDDLFAKLDNSSGDLERLREEKDQEIAILQEGMDSTIQQLSDVHQVREP